MCGYFLSYLLRVVNTVLAGDLARDLNIDAGQLGLLGSTYFVTFALAQLPLGILLDRYGPRRTEALLLLFASLGAAIFAYSQAFGGLLFGRALIGLGVSACLMASFKAFVQWFPQEKLPLINGIFMMSGGLGVLAASTPIEFALQFTSWRGIFWFFSACLLVTAALVWFIVPRRAERDAPAPISHHIEGFKFVFKSVKFWKIAPWAVASQATILSTSSLWSGPWLRDVAGYSREQIAHTLFWVGVAVILGFGTLGFFTERLTRRGFTTFQIAMLGMAIYMALQLLLILEVVQHADWLWIAIAYFASAGALSYAALSQLFAKELAGRVNTALNLLVFTLAFFAQWGLGEILNLFTASGSENYAPLGYQVAFSILLSLQLIGVAIYIYLDRTKK